MFNSSEIYRDEMSESMNWKYKNLGIIIWLFQDFFVSLQL